MLYAYAVWLTPLSSFLFVPSVFFFSLISLFKFYSVGFSTAFLYSTGLPSLAAMIAWRWADRYPFALFVLWPVSAFFLFFASVGATAHLGYAAYWLILPLLFLVTHLFGSHVVLRAMLSSMTAHTIGALLVAYFGAFTQWSTLIPVVPFERMVSAAGMLCTVAVMEGAVWVYHRSALCLKACKS